MSERTVNFKGVDNKRFKYEIPYSFSLIINLYSEIIKQLKLDPSVSITLFVTLVTGQQHIFKPEETIDSFIEKSKGGIVTIFVKAKPQPQAATPVPAQQTQDNVEPRRLPVLKPNEELHMENRGNLGHTVIEGKKALITEGLTIDLGCGASVHIPKGHSLLRSGKKIGFQQVNPNSHTFGCSPVVNLELLDD